MWYTYTKEQYSAIKKWHSKVCRHMDGTRKKKLIISKIVHTPKDKHYILLLLSEYKLLSKG